MEAPIRPPESPRTVPFSSVKQEEEGEAIQRDPSASDAPKQKAVQGERVQGEEAAKTSSDFGCVKQNISGETSCGERRSNEADRNRDVGTREEGPERNPEK